MSFLATAKARTRLRAALRKEQQPIIDKGREILDSFFKNAEVEATNEMITKMAAFYHVPNRDALLYRLGSGELTLDGYILKESPKTEKSLLSKIFRIGRNSRKSSCPGLSVITPESINKKETYTLRCTDKERNFVFADCCRPIPGDDVMGFINDMGQVEVHTLTCPRAQVLKAAHGTRIISTRWEDVRQKFLAEIHIEGVDRHGILQELTQMISNHLNIDIRSLHIDTDKEVFNCRLTVLVNDTEVVNDLCAKVKKIKGVTGASRVQDATIPE